MYRIELNIVTSEGKLAERFNYESFYELSVGLFSIIFAVFFPRALRRYIIEISNLE